MNKAKFQFVFSFPSSLCLACPLTLCLLLSWLFFFSVFQKVVHALCTDLNGCAARKQKATCLKNNSNSSLKRLNPNGKKVLCILSQLFPDAQRLIKSLL